VAVLTPAVSAIFVMVTVLLMSDGEKAAKN
jgi:hypothetical protein